MFKKLLYAIKQKIAIWVLSDPTITLRYNNQLRIEDKYEIIDLNVMISNDKVKKYNDTYLNNQIISIDNISNSPFIDFFLKSITKQLTDEIIEKRLIKILSIKDSRIPKENQGYLITIKVLKEK